MSDPATFDALVDAIRNDSVFKNNSHNKQTKVEYQVAIALYRLGHYGNAASTLKVALHFGISYGSVLKFTDRVLAAVCSDRFRASTVQWASADAKEVAMEWVESRSCPAWRKGWLMVDGTLVPLFQRPAFFGNNFFDRKNNYSTAVQVISTPDLRIIDFSVGRPGSQHDSSGWRDTDVYKRRRQLIAPDEWVWADSAYPLTDWCQSPYIKPEKEEPRNTTYNYHLSAIRVRSEHCIGFLKGRWASLKGLRVDVNSEKGLEYASLWIRACILLHMFAMKHESGENMEQDVFYRSGVRYQKKQREFEEEWRTYWEAVEEERALSVEDEEELELLEGKFKREQLKTELFDWLGEDMYTQ
ncbi:unnamed protein product [Peniophora sp. CBMAI 1063]|nr:unnamed protein product [Peniophora sp. CBMAI 1063]